MPESLASEEIAGAFGRYFHAGLGPTHDTLTGVFHEAGYASDDPYDHAAGTPSKQKRVYAVFRAARRRPAGSRRLVEGLLAHLRVEGCFVEGSSQHRSADNAALAAALRRQGWNLTDDGQLVTLGTINLATGGREALEEQVQRIRRSAEDPGALIGSAKDLLESVAKFVIVETGLSLTGKEDYGNLLYLARERLDLLPRNIDVSQPGGEAIREIVQSSNRIADAVNDLRRTQGAGHGRTLPTGVTPEMAWYVIRESTSVADFMLARLKRRYGV